jgi:predicted transcriptional regulator
LERHTEAGVKQYLKHRDAAVLAVLREQQKARERRETREKAEKFIANAYRLETKSSLKRARLQGICDEREIREYTKDVDIDTLLLAQRKEMSVKRTTSSELKLLRFFRQLTFTNNQSLGECQQ